MLATENAASQSESLTAFIFINFTHIEKHFLLHRGPIYTCANWVALTCNFYFSAWNISHLIITATSNSISHS